MKLNTRNNIFRNQSILDYKGLHPDTISLVNKYADKLHDEDYFIENLNWLIDIGNYENVTITSIDIEVRFLLITDIKGDLYEIGIG